MAIMMSSVSSLSFCSLLCYCSVYCLVCLGVMSSSTATVSAAWTTKTKADLAVKGLDDIVPAFEEFEGDMYAGLLPIAHPSKDKGEEGEYMFWFFAPEAPAVEDSLIIWFNGGPGCTSFSAGLFFEMGPITIPLHPAGYLSDPDEVHASMRYNPDGWHKASAIMYVEQPVNVGFSRGPHEPQNETDIGRGLDGFLQQFVHVFESYRDKRIFLVGESYAGMYVPSMAHFIHQRNKRRPQDEYHLNLAGIGLGNGWVDAIVQGGTVIDYFWWHGMIDSVTRNAMQREWEHCTLKGKHEPAPFHPYTVPDECGTMAAVAKAAGLGLLPRGLAPNVYDTSTWDPYDLINNPKESTIPRFFKNKEVQKILNVPDDFDGVWMGCIPGAGRRRRLEYVEQQEDTMKILRHRALHLLDQDRPESMHDFMVNLLDDAKISVLVYNGDRDATCNSVGSEMFLDQLEEWTGAAAWKDPEQYNRGLWIPDPDDEGQAIGGYSKEVQNLIFVIVTNSGHLVPFNRPVAALDLITRLLEGKSYVDKKIDPVFEAPPLPDDDGDYDSLQSIGERHNRRHWLEIVGAMIVAFVGGYFVSRSHHKKASGYESVPTASH